MSTSPMVHVPKISTYSFLMETNVHILIYKRYSCQHQSIKGTHVNSDLQKVLIPISIQKSLYHHNVYVTYVCTHKYV
jgi:hypothetical protein